MVDLWEQRPTDSEYMTLCKQWRSEVAKKGDMTNAEVERSFYSFMAEHLPDGHAEKEKFERMANR